MAEEKGTEIEEDERGKWAARSFVLLLVRRTFARRNRVLGLFPRQVRGGEVCSTTAFTSLFLAIDRPRRESHIALSELSSHFPSDRAR